MSALSFDKEAKNILDLFTFDLTTFFLEEDYQEVNCIEEAGVFMIEYEKILPWIEHNLFNKVIFRVFNDKHNIIGSSHINVCFPAKASKINKSGLIDLISSLHKIHKNDDENLGEWSNNDDENYNHSLIERLWTRGVGKNIYSIKLTYEKNTGLILKILFFNHLLNLVNHS